jgi:GNAT superfamily N-acetyltransferase
MPDSLLQRSLMKIRYYRRGVPWHGFLLRVSIDTMSKLGLRIEPFDLFLEGLGRAHPPTLPRTLEDAGIAFLTSEDMAEVAALPGRRFSRAHLEGRLRSGQLCLGVKHQGKLIAFTWSNLTECHIAKRRLFELLPDEVSLFDAYTAPEYRGQDLAPWMRYRCYEEMAKLGRIRCYSVTIAFNTPAIRFKQKLGAEVVGRGVYIDLLARAQFHLGASHPRVERPTRAP